MREEGEDDLSSLLLGVGSDLMNFDFKETFTDAFEVRCPNVPGRLLAAKSSEPVC